MLDLIAGNQDNTLVLLGIPLPKFLAAYKAAHNLQGVPTPTINFNFQVELDQINGTAPLGAEEAPPVAYPAVGGTPAQDPPPAPGDGELIVVIGDDQQPKNQDDEEEEQMMVDATNAIKAAAIGRRAITCRLIYDAVFEGTIKPIWKFHSQCKENEETKRIKPAFTLPRLNKAAQRVAAIIAKEPPTQMPVLHGLVNETANKATSAMERRIKSLKDQLMAAMGKTPSKTKKIQGRREENTSGDSEEQGHSCRPHKNCCPPRRSLRRSRRNNKGSTHTKGKKKPIGRKVSFNGKKLTKPTNLRK